MAAFQLTVPTAVRGYHVHREVWVPTVDGEFDCQQETDNREDRYALAVYGDPQSSTVLGHLPCKTLYVSFMFLEHDRTITGTVTDRGRYCHLEEA